MEKKFTLTITINPMDSPQNWKFEGGINGLEQLAIWQIVENIAKMQKDKMLNSKP